MVNPLDALPFIDGNTYETGIEELDERQVNPGTSKQLTLENDRGYYFASTTSIIGNGGDDTEIKIELDDFTEEYTPRELFEKGYVSNNFIKPQVEEFDTDNNIFTVVHNPKVPVPVNSNINISHRVDNDADKLRINTKVYSLRITQPKRFVRQYIEFVNPNLMAKQSMDPQDSVLDCIVKRAGIQ